MTTWLLQKRKFAQYTRYQTFLDMKSVNYAELGVEVLTRYNVLKILDSKEQELVLKAIIGI